MYLGFSQLLLIVLILFLLFGSNLKGIQKNLKDLLTGSTKKKNKKLVSKRKTKSKI